MSEKHALQPADCLLLHVLTSAIRVATEEQLANFMRSSTSTKTGFVRRLKVLRTHGLLECQRLVLAVPRVDSPLVTWDIGGADPNFNHVAWQLQKRWNTAQPRSYMVCWATRRAASLLGGVGGRLRQPLQIQHDLGLASVYIRYLETTNIHCSRWVGEDVLRRDPQTRTTGKLPDAALISPDGTMRVAIEFGGMYSAQRLRRFHEYHRRQSIGYEIW